MNAEKKNIILYALSTALRLIAYILSSEAILQTFLYSIGFSQNDIYIQSVIYQSFTTVVTLVMAGFADKGDVYKRNLAVLAMAGISVLIYLPLCFTAEIGIAETCLMLGASALCATALSLDVVCMYKIPYYIFSPAAYGPVTAACGIIGSGISFVIGAIMTALSSIFLYSDIMKIALIFAAALYVISGIMHLAMKNVPTAIAPDGNAKEERASIKETLSHPAFYTLLPGHLLRGFAYGTVTVLAVVASDFLGYSQEVTTAMVSVSSVAVVLGCILYGATTALISSRAVILIGTASFLLLPVMLIPDMPILFLVLYGLLLFGRTLIDYAVPTELLYAVPARIAGPYNAWRMAMHSGGIVIATTVALFLPAPAFIAVTVVAQIISGLNFFFAKVMKRSVGRAESEAMTSEDQLNA